MQDRMDFRRATILVTGGNSGIGRGLATAFAADGARVIVTGRNVTALRDTLDANPGMVGYELDISRTNEVVRFAATLTERHPDLNCMVNNAGMMAVENLLDDRPDLGVAERTVATNLLGPIALTMALLPHLRSQPRAAIVMVSSGLAFVPRADTPTYGATKAAIHSWTQALRHQLRDTGVSVTELVPPLVATNFAPGQAANPNAMPLDAFISEAVGLLCSEATPDEVLVRRVMPQRTAERSGDFEAIFRAINPL